MRSPKPRHVAPPGAAGSSEAREIGELPAEALACAGLGDVAASEGDAAQARAHWAAAEELWRRLGVVPESQLRRRAADRGRPA